MPLDREALLQRLATTEESGSTDDLRRSGRLRALLAITENEDLTRAEAPRLEAPLEVLVQYLETLETLRQARVGGGGGGNGASQTESAVNLLHWGYKNVLIKSASLKSHRRLYNGDCELVSLPLYSFCNIVKAKLQDVLSGVTIPAVDAGRLRNAAEGAEADLVGSITAVSAESELNARFKAVVGSGVAEVVNACSRQKQLNWPLLSFHAEAIPSDTSGKPDFLIKQHGVGHGADVCGGGGKMPNVMRHAVDLLGKTVAAVDDAVMQTCCYAQEKGWRFTFLSYYTCTFFVWRVAEDKYAITAAFLNDVAVFDLFTREVLLFIIWMSLEAPWDTQLPCGALRDLAVQLSQEPTVKVLKGRPREEPSQGRQGQGPQGQGLRGQGQQGQGQQGQESAHTWSWTPGSKQLQQTSAAPLDAVQQRDQPASWAPAEDAPVYPLASLQLSSICLGAGQCGPVVRGWLCGVPVAVKATDACKSHDIVKLLWHEAQIYDFLRELQGHLLPVLHGSG